jgi:hypothetical protein
LAVAALIALGATACGGGGSSSTNSTGAKNGAKFGSEEFGLTMDELANHIDAVESRIGACMTAAGFEYFPVDFQRVRAAMQADKSAPGLSDEEFVKQYGYGITTLPAAAGREIGLGERNMQIYNALGPSEQIAYDHTLFGENRDATFALTLEAEDFSMTGGCTRTAVAQVFSAAQLRADYFNPADAAMEQDPRMVKALSQWSDCMHKKGYDYAHPDNVEEDLHKRLQAITEGAPASSLTGSAADALKRLQGEELAVAAVATKCESDIIAPVTDKLEREYFGAPVN